MVRRDIHISEIVAELEHDKLLPAIVFRTSRLQCDVDSEQAGHSKKLRLAADAQQQLKTTIFEVCRDYDIDAEMIVSHPQYNSLIWSGIGAHHAGQLLMWRLLLEELMSMGCLRVLVATGTVAAGVDFPARTVVVTAHSRRSAEGYRAITAAEFQQMSGRAGRRGKDTVGFCLAAPAPFCDAREIQKIARRPAEPLVSAYFPSASTVLNLLRYRNVDDLRFTVERSLASYMDKKQAEGLRADADNLERELKKAQPEKESTKTAQRNRSRQFKRVRNLRRQAERLEARQMEMLDAALLGLSNLGHLEGDSLSNKGYWSANLCTTIVLELAEVIESRFVTDISAERLIAIVSSICGDEHRQYLKPGGRSVLTKEDVELLNEIIARVAAQNMPGNIEPRAVIPAAAFTVVTWLHAENWQQFRSLLALSGVAEGDAARLITQTADHLNQLTRLMDTHQGLALRAEEAKRRILRPPLTDVLNVELP